MSATGNNELATALADKLSHFHGGGDLHRHTLLRGFYHTIGVECLAREGKAYWLIDAIASHQLNAKARRADFQLWTLRQVKSGAWMLEMREDSDAPVLIRQRIEFSDFPLESIKLYAERGSLDGRTPARILMLPSER